MKLYKMTNSAFRYLTLIFTFIISSSLLYAQEEDPNPVNYSIDMFPKTPDAAALSKFVDIPPGSYTGVANFTIPLYTIQFEGGNIPIELSYTTTGIKVGEIASRVGLGWALNAGPSLSQQVMGSRDKSFKKPILTQNYEIPENPCFFIQGNQSECAIALESLGLRWPNADVKPDIFSYSLINGNGQFIMDFNGQYGIPRPYNQTKIKPLGTSHVTGMEMTDENGNIFTFSGPSANGLTSSMNDCFRGEVFEEDFIIPNYNIEKIKSPTNEEITYTYGKTTSSKSITSVVEQELIDFLYEGNQQNQYEQDIQKKCYNYTYSTESAITQIQFPGGKIFFYYNNDPNAFVESVRQDLYDTTTQGDVYLTRVVVKNDAGQDIKDYSLNYTYWTSTDNLTHIGSNSEYVNNVRKRLILKKVTDNLLSSEYKLSYYENYPLPNRISNSQDYWGVYNGKNNTTSIATVKTGNFDNPNLEVYLGANKEPDINYGVSGNLKKIEYPTGGYTEITYEADDYIKANYVPAVYEYQPQYPDVFASETDPIAFFTIPQNAINKVFHFYGTQHQNGQTQHGDCLWQLSHFNGTEYIPMGLPHPSTTGEGGLRRYDEPGNYKLEVIPDSNPNNMCFASYNWLNEIIVNDSDVRKTGTIRIQKLEYNSVDNGKILREFTYQNPSDHEQNPGKSSGKNLGDEIFSSLSTREKAVGPNFGSVKELIKSNNPGWQTNTVRGKAVGYDYVQEIYTSYKNPSENFIKEYKFKNDEYDDWAQHNPARTFNYTWPVKGLDRGILLEEKSYNGNKLVRKSKYLQNFDPYFNQFSSMYPYSVPNYSNHDMAFVMEIYVKKITRDALDGLQYTFRGDVYPIPNFWIKNTSVTTTEYDSNENPTIVVKDSMEYSSNYKHTFLSRKITENSLGESLQTEFYYPQDLTYYEQSSLMNKLVNRNQIASPVITKTFQNGIATSEQRTHYAHFYENSSNPEAGFILPQYVYAKKGEIGTTSTPADRKITYDYYDNKGNLTQYTLEDGTPVSILWGYNGQYPIAKVEGLPYNATISSLAGTLQGLSNNGTLSAGSFESLRNLSGAVVTCYIYKPLVGVTTIIRPNGQKETYEYDASGRLMHVKDHNGNILKKMDYHYKN